MNNGNWTEVFEVFNSSETKDCTEEFCKLLQDPQTYVNIEYFVSRITLRQLIVENRIVCKVLLQNLHHCTDPIKVLNMIVDKIGGRQIIRITGCLLGNKELRKKHIFKILQWLVIHSVCDDFIIEFFHSNFSNEELDMFLITTTNIRINSIVNKVFPEITDVLDNLAKNNFDAMHLLAYYSRHGHWCGSFLVRYLSCPESDFYKFFIEFNKNVKYLHTKQKKIALALLLCLNKVTRPFVEKCLPGNIRIPKPVVLIILFKTKFYPL